MNVRGVRIENKEYNRRSLRLAIVYVDKDRPFNKGDILGDFGWRREHKPPKIHDEIRHLIVPLINKELGLNLGGDMVRVVYDRFAGCSTCPCSPGFVIYAKHRDNKTDKYLVVWLIKNL